MVSNVEPFVVKNNEQNTMNNEQENLLQFIRGMARSASPSSFYHQACPEQRQRVTKTLTIIEQCKSASAIYLKGVLHAVSFIEGR
jgi:hypothetical protein